MTRFDPPIQSSAVLTHHWLVRRRGGEKVLACFRESFPNAPLYTLVYRAAAELRDIVADQPVVTSILQKLPGAWRRYPQLLPLMPWAYRRMRLPSADLVLCSDAALAKAIPPPPGSRLVCYCHSPPRYLHEPALAEHYRRSLPMPLRPLWEPLTRRVAQADLAAAARVDLFIANSRHVAERIRRIYQRESIVIHPPVELAPASALGPRDGYYVCVGHHVPYKRLDLAVAACRALRRELVVIGDGPDVARLKRSGSADAGDPPLRIIGHVQDAELREHYRRARGLIFPGEEDFGIVPVEAISHGCPVIAYGVGGATETVRDGVSGVLFGEQTVDAVVAALQRAETLTFDPRAMHADVTRFSRARFLAELRAALARPARRGAHLADGDDARRAPA